MASVPRRQRTADERSGGKILRGRRFTGAASRTPYDRPAAAARAPPQNPNWLTGVIFPTSRMIATGATKLLSSVFGPETSSSSSSSSDGDCSYEEGMDDENDDNTPFDGVVRLNEKNETTPGLIDCFRKEPQLTVGKSETKRGIEKLLMQETFSREECNRLIKIINSRVIDGSPRQDGELDNPDLCTKAVMEARQWLEEKKVASSSKPDMDHGASTLSPIALSQAAEGESVSPVEIAKVYMRARPPWASPSATYGESGTPSPIGRELLKDETPYSVAGNSFSSSKKIYSLSGGSWNIQEEIRRVRSKATDDMLKTVPSTKLDLSSFALERKSVQKSLLGDKKEQDWGGKVHDFNSLQAAKSVDASVDLGAGGGTYHGLPASVLELTHNNSRNEDLSSQPLIFSSAQNQDLEGIQTVEGVEHADSNSRHPIAPDLALEHDSGLGDRTGSSAKESALRDSPNANGFLCPGSSFAAVDVEQNPRPSDDKSQNPVSPSHDKLVNNSVPMEETCELLSEASMEVPAVNETNDSINAANGSQNSSSMHRDELSQELTQPYPELKVAGKTTNRQGRKVSSRYNNRKTRGKA